MSPSGLADGESPGTQRPGRTAGEAREAILNAIRSANAGRSSAAPAPCPPHTRPAVAGDLAQRLRQKLEGRSATMEALATIDDVPAAVLRYLSAHELPGRLACAPALASLAWPANLLDLCYGTPRRDELISVTPCIAAVAESGSVVLVSSPQSPTTLAFVPEHHLVLVRREQIVRHFEDVWRILRELASAGGMPRAVNVIAGPSRTADVEQTIQLGAHGPRHLHVMLVGRAG